MNDDQKRQRMAIMEAAISASLSHPNVVQTFTYRCAARFGDESSSTRHFDVFNRLSLPPLLLGSMRPLRDLEEESPRASCVDHLLTVAAPERCDGI